jgi:hypothetical protein
MGKSWLRTCILALLVGLLLGVGIASAVEAPTGLCVAGCEDGLYLTWTPHDEVARQIVYRRMPFAERPYWITVATLGPRVTQYVDTAVDEGVVYAYIITARIGREVAHSRADSSMLGAQDAMYGPTYLDANVDSWYSGGYYGVTLSAASITTKASGYLVYRRFVWQGVEYAWSLRGIMPEEPIIYLMYPHLFFREALDVDWGCPWDVEYVVIPIKAGDEAGPIVADWWFERSGARAGWEDRE